MRDFALTVRTLISLCRDIFMIDALKRILNECGSGVRAPEMLWRYYGPKVSSILQDYMRRNPSYVNEDWFISMLSDFSNVPEITIKEQLLQEQSGKRQMVFG